MLFWGSIAITMLFYSLSRAIFLIWNWKTFQNMPFMDLLQAFIHGLRFDIWAIVILSVLPFLIASLVGLYRKEWGTKVYKVLFCVIQIPFLICTIGDCEFSNFSGRRLTTQAFVVVREMQGKTSTIFTSYPFMSSFVILLLILYVFLIWRLRARPFKKMHVMVSVLLVVLAARGGWQKKPLNFAHAQLFAQPAANNLVMNSTFSILQTVTRQPLSRSQYYSQDQMLAHLNANFPGVSLLKDRPLALQNVVLIILESFSLEHMGYPHGDTGYTPFLDELAQRSLFFKNNFANARRSIEGIAAILGGVPTLMEEPFISSPFLTNYFLGAGTVLNQKNYHSSFFHGAANGTMYFDQFMKSAGVQNYFGMNEYPNAATDTDGIWGIYDEPFLQWMITKLNTFPRPFFSTVFTLSSHHPFNIPSQYKDKFPVGPSEIHQSIAYTDYALRQFFAAAAKQDWYENTLFIITADHTFKNWRPEYNNELGRFKAPLIFFHPQFGLANNSLKYKWPEVNKLQVTSQIDILPSLMDFLNIHLPDENKLGRSVFRTGDRSVVLMLDHKYWLVKQDYFLSFEKPDQFSLYKFTDPGESHPLNDPVTTGNLEKQLKSSIQYFSEGMWDNRLYYPIK